LLFRSDVIVPDEELVALELDALLSDTGIEASPMVVVILCKTF
jgi:hypothetical protein